MLVQLPGKSATTLYIVLRVQESDIHSQIPFLLAVVFVATAVRSAFGFGEALIAVPLLTVFLPLNVAAPLAVLLSIASRPW